MLVQQTVALSKVYGEWRVTERTTRANLRSTKTIVSTLSYRVTTIVRKDSKILNNRFSTASAVASWRGQFMVVAHCLAAMLIIESVSREESMSFP